jgi:hypothetical protein
MERRLRSALAVLIALFLYLPWPSATWAADLSKESVPALGQEPPVPVPAKPCTVSMAEFPDPIADPQDIRRLMQKYFDVCDFDLRVLDGVFEKEARDDRWATRLEKEIEEATAGLHGVEMTGECRASLCRFKFESESSDPFGKMLDLGHKFRDRLRGTPYVVGVHELRAEGGGSVVYLQ